MTKRQRDTQLTKEELEQEIAAEEAGGQTAVVQGGVHMADISVLKQRKIVKVKRHNQVDSSVTAEVLEKPKQFVLAGGKSLSAVTKPATTQAQTDSKENGSSLAKEAQAKGKETKASFSFGPEIAAADKSKQEKEGSKESPDKTEEQPKNLFGSAGASGSGKLFAVASTGTFGGKDIADVQKKPAGTGLFGQPVKPISTNLFGDDKKFKPAEGGTFGGKELPKIEPTSNTTPTKTLFGGGLITAGANGSKPFGGGLFGAQNSQSKEGSEPAKTTSLFNFGGGAQTTPAATTGTLFGGTTAKTGTLFGGAPPSTSVFSQTGTSLFGPPKQASTEAKDDEDDKESDGEKSPPHYATENSNVEFAGQAAKNPYTKAFEKHVSSVKIVKPESHHKKMGAGVFSIAYRETDGKRLYLTVFRAGQRPLFTGLITVQSRIKRVEEKASKYQLKIAVLMTEPRLQAFCTCNFSRHEDMVSYEEEFGKAIAFLKEQGTTPAAAPTTIGTEEKEV